MRQNLLIQELININLELQDPRVQVLSKKTRGCLQRLWKRYPVQVVLEAMRNDLEAMGVNDNLLELGFKDLNDLWWEKRRDYFGNN